MILALDTATDTLSVAVGDRHGIAAEIDEPAPRAHLSRLLPAIDAVLKEAGTDLESLSALAVGIGPGSFTGVRIGVAVGRGLAQALGKPLIGISSLDALALAAVDGRRSIQPVLDAKRKQVYTAGYSADGRRQTDYRLVPPGDLAAELARSNEMFLLTGDGLADYGEIFKEKLNERFAAAPSFLQYPRASVSIKLASEKIEKGGAFPYIHVKPIYIRLSDAEEALKRKKSS